jgi:hypothetical protein
MSVGGKSLPNFKELTGGRSHALVHGFRANFILGKSPTDELCLRRRGGLPLPRSIRTLVLVVLAAEQVPTCSRAQRLVALASEC